MSLAQSGARGARGRLATALHALWALLLCAGCAGTPARASLDRPPAPTPTGTTVAAPTAAPPPTATALPPDPTATAPPTATPTPAPPRVGLQVGHWRIEEHADEMARLRLFSGAYYGGYDEWEVNMVIAEAARERLEAAGVTVDLLPARVPVGYEADAFVSIHVDGVTGPAAATRRGWKVATPFRASAASEGLAAAIAAVYPAVTGLPTDAEEASFNLRAYYAFAHYRYWHSVAPTTPAAIVELAFMTHPADRELIFERPGLLAEGLADGILAYLDAYHPLSAEARAPVGRGMLRPATEGTPLFARPSEQSAVLLTLGPETRLAPMEEREGWALAFTHGGEWELGWVRLADVVETGEGLAPPHPRP